MRSEDGIMLSSGRQGRDKASRVLKPVDAKPARRAVLGSEKANKARDQQMHMNILLAEGCHLSISHRGLHMTDQKTAAAGINRRRLCIASFSF